SKSIKKSLELVKLPEDLDTKGMIHFVGFVKDIDNIRENIPSNATVYSNLFQGTNVMCLFVRKSTPKIQKLLEENNFSPIDAPVVNTIPDTNVCDGPIVIDAGSGYQTYLWNTGEDTQTITADTAGIYTCIVSNAGGCESTIEINVTDCASTENALTLDWNVYPNPTTGMINIQSSENQITYVVFDLVGNKIAEGQSKEINMIDYPSGTFLIELQNSEGLLKTFRIVKK
ncbi:T9SS type A sorting domain-containing protein, partial [Lishizhenia sp.]|uniref:T9SS type A sorting domain-containing protein n=1 Tax=Lishizhenia sp. TaxID=2497594 RepID=UPI00299D2076